MRGERSDYDAWAAMGCTGWAFDDIFPHFLRAERFHGAPSQSHGSLGPLSVSPIRNPQPIGQHVIDAFSQIGITPNEDYCDGSQAGVFRNFATQRNGQRCSVARAYLEPVMQRPNLTVLTGAHVDRVLIEGGGQVGSSIIVGASVTWSGRGRK